MPLCLKNTKDFFFVFGLNESLGADGIIAATDIESVTCSEGDMKGFPPNDYMKETGLDLGNIDPVNMSANDAGSAFVAKLVDAAASYFKLSPARRWKFRALSSPPSLVRPVAASTPCCGLRPGCRNLLRAM